MWPKTAKAKYQCNIHGCKHPARLRDIYGNFLKESPYETHITKNAVLDVSTQIAQD